jgi:hypothetical protein
MVGADLAPRPEKLSRQTCCLCCLLRRLSNMLDEIIYHLFCSNS